MKSYIVPQYIAKYFINIALFFLIAFCASQAFAVKRSVLKKDLPLQQPKIHPYTHLLNSTPIIQSRRDKAIENNKLLVILVDFQEETIDDPFTTGNGKFLTDADPDYRTTIASPPHNQEYFEANLNALRYYYLAASQNDFNLQYDVYPKNMPAYTLPQTMSYYNPVDANSTLFVSRIEEYFKESFELADSIDSEIDFSKYGHFMVIHAGSDWQHDVFGDTPGDLPSFFIRVAPGKEAVVDNGNVLVTQACNVPSTISQDFDIYEINGDDYYTGYGALNGVMAHEFGHSLGAVDLYNVYYSSPMVGVFDIMDSGGAGVTEDPSSPGVLIEGELPSLPGAFTRMIMFEESFQQRGFLKDANQLVNQYDLSDIIRVSASSQRQEQNNIIPNLIKFRMSETEYIILENRSVDPDNDGGTAIVGDLDGRVALYPTSFDDPDDTPTYEYDYLLPSFIDEQFNAIGGGILVWHVDENLLYNQGQTDADGVFVSNFDNNTVNYSYTHRGVRVVEADGLDDIGNIYSWFWTGTSYEYFHTYKPQLDEYGWFQNWTTNLWKPTLNSESVPPLHDYKMQPSFYGLYDIGQPQAVMSFKLSAGTFNSMYPLGDSDSIQIPLPIINSPLTENVLPICRGDSLHFYIYDAEMGINTWTELINPIPLVSQTSPFNPIVSDANSDGFKEVVIPRYNGYNIIEFNNDNPSSEDFVEDSSLTTSPLFAQGSLYIANISADSAKPAQINNEKSYSVKHLTGYKLAASDSAIIVQRHNSLIIQNPALDTIIESYLLPEDFYLYEPVIIQDSLSGEFIYLVVSDTGNIYKCYQGEVTCIFRNNYPGIKLTNLAISSLGDYSPCIVFGQKDKLYALKHDGTLLPGYPVYLEGYVSKPLSHIKIRKNFGGSSGNPSEIIYVTLEQGGFLAIGSNRDIDSMNCIIDVRNNSFDQNHYILSESKLFWFFVNNDDYLMAAEMIDIDQTPFLWSGFRNGSNGLIKLRYFEPTATNDKIAAFVYPSPAKTNLVNVRVENPIGLIKLHVYDITGKLLYKHNYETDFVVFKDMPLDVSKFSSGVYIVTVENNGQTKRIKFAVEK